MIAPTVRFFWPVAGCLGAKHKRDLLGENTRTAVEADWREIKRQKAR